MTADEVKSRAAELGFDLCGIAPVATHKELAFLREWLGRGYAGEMQYLERSADRREDVRAVMPSARSVVCLGTVYNTDRPYSTEIAGSSTALIAPPPGQREKQTAHFVSLCGFIPRRLVSAEP